MKLMKSFSTNFYGFILLESIISIFLITLILIPIYNFSSLFIKLKNKGIACSTSELNTSVKPLLTLGYNALSTSSNNISFGTFSNIGMENNINTNKFIYFKIEGNIYNRDIFYISTKLTKYRDCI